MLRTPNVQCKVYLCAGCHLLVCRPCSWVLHIVFCVDKIYIVLNKCSPSEEFKGCAETLHQVLAAYKCSNVGLVAFVLPGACSMESHSRRSWGTQVFVEGSQ